MKVIINKQGHLEIEKCGTIIKQFCCKSQASVPGVETRCGLWCPLMNIVDIENHHCKIEICEGRVLKPKTIEVRFNQKDSES